MLADVRGKVKPEDVPVVCSRRDVLKLMAGVPFLGIGAGGVRAVAPDPKPAGGILRRPVPATGEQLPAVGLGTWLQFDVGTGDEERAPLEEVLRLFVEMGGSVIDSSPMYGNAERVVGDLAAELGLREALFVATKVWTRGRESGIRQMEQSMRRLRADPTDLMQVHNLVDWRTHLQTLRSWKNEGRIRYLGVTHYTTGAYDALAAVMESRELDFVQLNYSVVTREAERRLLPLAAERGIAVIVNRPFEGGALFRRVRGTPLPDWAAEFDCRSWAQFFLKYILSHSAVTCAIPGTSDPRHLVDNMRAGYGRLPEEPTRRRMAQYAGSL